MSDKTSDKVVIELDDDYYRLEMQVNAVVLTATTGRPALFLTDVPVDELYLSGIEEGERRKHYDCRACRDFLKKVGSLAEVLPDGSLRPAIWADLDPPPSFRLSVSRIIKAFERAKIVGAFASEETTFGRPRTGDWTHLSGLNGSPWRAKDKTADQWAAEVRENVGLIGRAVADFPILVIKEAVRVLESEGALPSSEKALPMARWLVEATIDLGVKLQPGHRANLLWQLAATAPPGFAHVKNAILGTLIEAIKDGKSFDEVRRSWKHKVNPETYQRPTSVSEGAIEAAEKLVEKLDVARSLPRRYGKLTDVLSWLWRPTEIAVVPAESKSPFSGLKPTRGTVRKAQPVKPLELPPVLMTAEKFLDELLPVTLPTDPPSMPTPVVKVEVLVPHHGAFFGLVSTTDPEAPPILQWDSVDSRNSVSYYYYVRGSYPRQWGLAEGEWTECTGISRYPWEWQAKRFEHLGGGLFFFLKGCVDVQDAFGCFFPSFLRSELHPVRAVLEAYAKANPLSGRDEANACGIGFGRGVDKKTPTRVRLTFVDGSIKEMIIDRWS